MAILDFTNHGITTKITYFGAIDAGVSTNVRQLHKLLEGRRRSKLRHFGTGEETELSWCFDYEPEEGQQLAGYDIRIRVFSLQSGREWESHRDEVLAGTDAIVFVADARSDRTELNEKAMIELIYSLSRQNLELASLPVVIQVNHTDGTNARPTDRVVRELNPHGFPVFPSIARDGRGVLDTHREAVGMTLARLRDNVAGDQGTVISLTALSRAAREHNEDVIRRHLAAIDRPLRVEKTRRRMRAPLVPPPPSDFQVYPVGLTNHTPIEILHTEIKGRRIYVDFVTEPPGSESTQRWTVVLDTMKKRLHPARRHQPDPTNLSSPFGTHASPRTTDTTLWYGIAGLMGGMISGIMLGYLLFG